MPNGEPAVSAENDPFNPSSSSISSLAQPSPCGPPPVYVEALAVSPLPTSLDTIRSTIGHPNFGFAIVWTGLLIGVQMAIGLLIGIAIFALHIVRGEQLGPDSAPQFSQDALPLLMTMATASTLVVALVVARSMLGRGLVHRLRLYSLTAGQWIVIVLLVFPLQILASEVSNWVSELVPSTNGAMFESFSQLPWPFVFIVMCVFPGVGEEVFFRGFLSRGLISRHGLFWGTLFTAFLFGAVHVDPVQASGAFALGLALQYVYQTTGSLVAPITVHILNNGLAFLGMRYGSYFPIEGLTASSADGLASHTPWWILLLSGISTIVLLRVLRGFQVQSGAKEVDLTTEPTFVPGHPQF